MSEPKPLRTPEEHYNWGERLLERAMKDGASDPGGAQALAAMAQAHFAAAASGAGLRAFAEMALPPSAAPPLTVPCDGKCGNDDPHDGHLAPGALEYLHGGTDG